MSSLAASDHPEAPLFSDGLGERVVAADGATGELLQILRLRPALMAVPSFEFALRERAARLANFRHGYYARIRRVDRGMAPGSALSIVSDHIEGTRLSDILRVAHERSLQLDLNAALCLIRQLVPAVAVLHENARDVAHGLIAPERLIVTPNARIVIVEHVLGAAIEQLQFGRDRLWQEFRIAMPPSAGLPRFDHRADVVGMGLVALALILGRPVRADEYPHQISKLLNEAREHSAFGDQAAAVAIAAHVALARAPGGRPACLRIGARSDDGVRGARRRRFDVRRGADGARDLPRSVQRLSARTSDHRLVAFGSRGSGRVMGSSSGRVLDQELEAPAASWTQEPAAPAASWTQELEAPADSWTQEPEAPADSWTQALDAPADSWTQEPDAPAASWAQEPKAPASAWAQEFDASVPSRIEEFEAPAPPRSKAFRSAGPAVQGV